MLISILIFISYFVSNVYSVCTSLSVSTFEEQLSTVCYQAVDYEFYFPPTMTLSALNTIAMEKLNGSKLAILPDECKKSLLKLACSNIYLKCTNNPNGNIHVYSDVEKIIPLPFERPCVSICTDVSSKCLGLLNLFDLEPNCTAKYDYLFGYDSIYGISGLYPYQYDQSNSNYCNNITATIEVASSYEPYLKSGSDGACAGIVTELYIPPSNAIDASFSPILPPYVIQSIIEETISSNIEQLPKWLGESCHLALRKYFCGSYMLKPQLITFESIIESFGPYAVGVEYELQSLGVNVAALSTFDFYLPSYPSLEVCEDYSSKCGAFIALSGISALIPNCSSKLSNIDKFPNKTQTIVTLSLSSLVNVDLSTDPNYMTNSNDNDYQPSCPRGFVIPEDPYDSHVTFVPGSFSACAISCKEPLFTIKEYETLSRVSDIGSNVALPLVVFLIIIWMFDESRRKQYLVISFNIIALIVTIQCVYMSSIPFDKKFCRNNAVAITSRDGLRGCNVQSFFMIYFILAEVINWCLIAVDLFFKIILRYNTNNFYPFYFALMFILPIISVGLLAGLSKYGYYGLQSFCLTNAYTGNWDIAIFVLPIFIIALIGSICMIIVIIKIVQTTKNVKLTTNSTRSKSKVKRKSIVVPVSEVKNSDNIPITPSNHITVSNNDSNIYNTNTSTKFAQQMLTSDDEKVKQTVKDMSKRQSLQEEDRIKYVVKSIRKNSAESSLSISSIPWKMIRTPLIFVILYFGVWFTIFLLRFQAYYNTNNIKKSFISWTECVFTYYDGTNSYIDICGEHPKVRPSYGLTVWVAFVVNSHAIIVSSIFLLNPTIWFTYCDKVTTYILRSSASMKSKSRVQSSNAKPRSLVSNNSTK